MVLLRALTTALDSTRLPITLYQTFSEVIFSPFSWWCNWSCFPTTCCHRLGGLVCLWELTEKKQLYRDMGYKPLSPQAAGMDSTGNLIWKGTIADTKISFWFSRKWHKTDFYPLLLFLLFKCLKHRLNCFHNRERKWHQYKSTLKIGENTEWQSENKILPTWKISFCSFISHLKEMEKTI